MSTRRGRKDDPYRMEREEYLLPLPCPRCSESFSNKTTLLKHVRIVHQHHDRTREAISFNCSYCKNNVLGTTKFSQHVSNCHSQWLLDNGYVNDPHRQANTTMDAFQLPRASELNMSQKLPIVMINDHSSITSCTQSDAEMNELQDDVHIKHVVRQWGQNYARGDSEKSISVMMEMALYMAAEHNGSSRLLRTLKTLSYADGRMKFLKDVGHYIEPLLIRMPDESKAYIFPFESTLRLHLMEIWDLLEWNNLRLDLAAPEGLKTVFIAYFTDDVGVCNPLNAANRKNTSIRPMIFQLLNTPAHYRATNESKQMLAIAKAQSIKSQKHAWNSILADFLQVLVKFQNGGFEIKVNGVKHNLAIRLGATIGDMLGQFELLGLTQSFGPYASHVCFRCTTSGGSRLNAMSTPQPYTRTRKEIIKFSAELQNIKNPKEKRRLVQKNGIHFLCPFYRLPYFCNKIAKFDIFHIFAQGLVPKEISLFLNHLRDNIPSLTSNAIISKVILTNLRHLNNLYYF